MDRSKRHRGGSQPSRSSERPVSVEEKYRSFFDHAEEGIFQTSSSGQILDLNPALARIFRYRSPREMKEKIKHIPEQIYTDRAMREKSLRMVETRGHAEFEFQYRRKDQTLGWGHASVRAVRNAAGETAYYEGFFLDITDRKEMEEKLRETRDSLGRREIERALKIAQLNAVLAADIRERKIMERVLRARERELKRRSVKLGELNITLRTLLEQREIDRRDLERQIMTNIDDLIMPCIERLRNTEMTDQATSLIQSLQDNLNDLTSPFLCRIKAEAHLTFTELEIANFIKNGKTSKEIGTILKLSAGTIDFHRNMIRMKLGIRGKKISLQAYLMEHS